MTRANGEQLAERRVNTGLGGQVVVGIGREFDRQVPEVVQPVSATHEGRVERDTADAAAGVFLNIVRIDERDDQTERLVPIVGVEEVDSALTMELVERDALAGGR